MFFYFQIVDLKKKKKKKKKKIGFKNLSDVQTMQ